MYNNLHFPSSAEEEEGMHRCSVWLRHSALVYLKHGSTTHKDDRSSCCSTGLGRVKEEEKEEEEEEGREKNEEEITAEILLTLK
jgi:hypothetical protein